MAKAATARKAAPKAASMRACVAMRVASGKAAKAVGPCRTMAAKAAAVLSSRPNSAKKMPTTMVTPAADPTERDSCTEAAAAPSMAGGANDCAMT